MDLFLVDTSVITCHLKISILNFGKIRKIVHTTIIKHKIEPIPLNPQQMQAVIDY